MKTIGALTIVLALLIPGSLETVSAQTTLYSGSQGKKIGLRVISDGVSESDSDYTDQGYQLFKAYKTKKHDVFGKNDFYYRLKIIVPSKLKSTSVDCAASPFLKALFDDWFAIQQAALINISANIWFEPAIGSNIDIVTDKAPILMFSEGAAAGQLSTGHGCFLKEIVGKEFPPIRFEGGNASDGKDIFHVNLDIAIGNKLDAKFVSNALLLFSTASSAVFPWAASSVTSTAKLFDSAISDAGSFSHEDPINFSLKPRSTFYFTIPGAFKQRVIEIAPYLSASVILPSANLTPAGVLASTDLAVRACGFSAIAGGTCTTTPVRIGLIQSAYLKLVSLPDKYQLPPSIFDPDSQPQLALKLCQVLRLQLDDALHLSTVDQMLVRWALTKESGLQDALTDPVKSVKFLAAIQKVDANATIDAVQTTCWNKGDDEVLAAVTASKLKDH